MNALLAVLLALPPVVMYHRVDVAAPSDWISRGLTVSPRQFAQELDAIDRAGLRTIGIAELVRDLTAGRTPSHAVLLTFDDGYGDGFDYALPILRRFGDRATFFVNTGTIGTPHHLTWRELGTMAHAGMSIECHGVDHRDLRMLTPAQQWHQIDGCIRTLQDHLHVPVLAYAYPSGAFDARTILLERRAGLLLGFTTDPRFETDPASPYQIVRVRALSGMTDADFVRRLRRCGYVRFATRNVP